jgi:hypothetical protein
MPVASPIQNSGQTAVKDCDLTPNQASVALPTVALTSGAAPAPRATNARTSRKVSSRTGRPQARITSVAPTTAPSALPTKIRNPAASGLWNHTSWANISLRHPARIHHGQLCGAVRISVAMKTPPGGQMETVIPGTMAST